MVNKKLMLEGVNLKNLDFKKIKDNKIKKQFIYDVHNTDDKLSKKYNISTRLVSECKSLVYKEYKKYGVPVNYTKISPTKAINENGDIISIITRRKIKTFKNRHGYYVFSDTKGYFKTPFVHRVLGILYVPNPNPAKFDQINHIDGNKLNNSIDNLEWCDNEYNQKHARKLGLYNKNNPGRSGEEHSQVKLREIDVEYIRNHPNISGVELAGMFSVSPQTICDIRKNRSWTHILNKE